MIFMPPRHGKSALCSETFPAWFLGIHPDQKVILASYSATLAKQFGRSARDLLAEHGPSLYGVSVREDVAAAGDWAIARRKGGMYVCGVGGSLTGMGGKILIVDDPIKNMAEADSATYRDNVYAWFLSVARTRLTPDGRIILVMTRWHHDDLAGRLLSDMQHGGDQWDVVSLPAIAEEHDQLGRQPGQALWPEQFSEASLMQTKASMPSRMWISLYQQRPSPEQGSIFHREWFSTRYTELPKLTKTVLSVDGAWKQGVSSDWSVIATWATDGINYYLLDVWRDKVEYPELIRAIKDQAEKHKPNAVLIEDAASGIPAIQELRRTTRLPIIAYPPKGSKQSRAEAVSPIFQAQKVSLPEHAPWVGDWIEEHLQFPQGEHDDQVDTTSMALAWLRDGGGKVEYMPNPFDIHSMDDLTEAQAAAMAGWDAWSQ
jgi:predicted phage terminase large subunit-like protein